MKTFKFLTTISFILLFISCTTDDVNQADTSAQEEDLIGSWNLTEVTQEGTGSTTISGITVNGNITSFGKDIDAQIVFSSDPNSFAGSGGFTDVVTASIATLSLTEEIQYDTADFINQGTWSLNSGILTLNQSGESLEIRITQLNTSTLKIELDINEDIIVDGTQVTIDTTVKMSFTK